MRRAVTAFGVVLLLAGCATPGLPVSRVSTIVPTVKGAEGIDVYAGRRRAGEAVPALAGDQLVEVRTYEQAESGFPNSAGKEFAGATCTLQTRHYTARVVTPARVRVPLYRGASSTIAVTCEREGYQPRSVVLAVYNKTKADRLDAATNTGLLGVLAVATFNELTDDSDDEFRYPHARVIMAPLAAKRRGKGRRSEGARMGLGAAQ